MRAGVGARFALLESFDRISAAGRIDHVEDVSHCIDWRPRGTDMALPNRVDFVAYDERGQPVLLVEVKSIHDTSELWAARFRRNLLEHGTLPNAPFFLIATPERLYFWRQDATASKEEPPQFTMDATAELKPYFERFKQTPEGASGEVLELILFSWLNDLAESGQSRVNEDSSLEWLSGSGLLETMKRARIELSAV